MKMEDASEESCKNCAEGVLSSCQDKKFPVYGTEDGSGVQAINRHSEFDATLNDNQRAKFWWPSELLFWLLSVVFLLATAITLRVFEGSVSPIWPYGISINTIVAIFTTFEVLSLQSPVQAAIAQLKWNWFSDPNPLRDYGIIAEASSGPLGSFLLLLKRGGGRLGIVGGILMLLFLTVAPFSQQIISLESGSIMAGQSTVPIALAYTTYGGSESTALLSTFFGTMNASKRSKSNDMNAYCPTANCSWPSFESLGICSYCHDATDSLNKDGFLPNGFGWNESVVNDYKAIAPQNMYYCQRFPILLYDSSGATAVYSIPLDPIKLHNSTFKHADSRTIVLHSFTKWVKGAVSMAEECILSFCVRNYSAVWENGAYVETVLDQSERISFVSKARKATLISPIWTYQIQQPGSAATFNFTSDARYTIAKFLGSNFRGAVNRCSFNPRFSNKHFLSYNWDPHLKMRDTSAHEHSSALHPPNIWSDYAGVTNSIYKQYFHEYEQPPETLTPLFEKLATSMTHLMRDPADRTSENQTSYAKGSIYKHATIVRIRWAWIALPVVLEILALAFLIAVMRSTTNKGIQRMGRDNIAVLFNGLDEKIRKQAAEKSTSRELDKFAKSTLVQLTRESHGWRLTQVLPTKRLSENDADSNNPENT